MKSATIIILSILALVFILIQAFSMKSTNQTEMYSYEVLESHETFEIRRYEKALFSYVTMTSDSYSENSRNGFKDLAGYIFGGNETGEKIAMTTPVEMEMDDSVTMKFMVPSGKSMADLPKPNNAQVKFKMEESRVVAAIRFGGWASDEKIEEHKSILFNALDERGIEHKSIVSFFGYNPPYEVLNRRNEVVVELINYKPNS